MHFNIFFFLLYLINKVNRHNKKEVIAMFQIVRMIIDIINFFAIFYMIFKEKRSANSIIAWVLVIYIAPLVGFIAFLLLGRKINNANMFGIKEIELKLFKDYMRKTQKEGYVEKDNKNYDMINSIERMGYSPYREKNQVMMYSDGKEFFSVLLDSLRKAEKSINIEFYIFKTDGIGSEILSVLEEKASKGVEVRLLYDSVGSRTLNRRVLKKLTSLGGKTGEFFPSWLKIINLNMNFRNHRKIVVIDNKVGFVGGFNVGDEYLGKDEKFGYWRDTHVKIEGYAVKDLNSRFLADWRYATKEEVDIQEVFAENSIESVGDKGIQILSSGPNLSDRFEIKLAYLKMIQKARNYIYIQSPYLIIDNSISDALKLAALSGVDVRIMIPGKGDHPFVYWANLFYAGDLLDFGVKIYHYDRNAFLHAKTLVIDDEICSVGTANMDTRSFELNFEINAYIYSSDIACKQKKQFEKDILKSNQLTLEMYKGRNNKTKIKEGLSKLFSSIL